MSPSSRRDPLFDPTLPPAQWAAVRRRRRVRGILAVLLTVLVGVAAAWGFRTLSDRTRNLTPAQVAEAAGLALLAVERYDFAATLAGSSPDGFFPETQLTGEYQADPPLLHLAGSVGTGTVRTPFEYYLVDGELYVRQVRSGGWLRAPTADAVDVVAFQPDNLAAPLVAGLRGAELLRRERMGDSEAVVLALDLDPAVMQVRPPGDGERVLYRLWVDTRTLRPLQFTIQVDRPASTGTSFQYRLSWTYPESGPLALPDELRQAAAD
ncbi:MAG: hypothetical protein AB2385_08465 [Symbiobacterium sp.]|uniref:hypothetical protein n=1 Tax=Symbiobacterium sp. TaxID=1971213 RepID=UPI003463DC70